MTRSRSFRPGPLLLAAGLALAAAAGCNSTSPSSQILVYAYLRSFSGRGAQPDSLTTPSGIAVLGDGVLIHQVWVAEDSPGRISRFGFDGSYLGTFAVPGGAGGGASALAATGDSLVYILQSTGQRVCVVDTLGNQRLAFPTDSGATPVALAVAAGKVYVTERRGGHGKVQVYGSDGSLQGVIGLGGADSLRSPAGIAVQDSSVYVCDPGANTVKLYRPDGRYVGAFGGAGSASGFLNDPQGIAVTDDGNLIVADQDNLRIQEFTRGGTFVTQFGRDQLGSPATLRISAVAIHGSSVLGEFLYFNDLDAGRVYIVVRRYVYAQRPRLPLPAI